MSVTVSAGLVGVAMSAKVGGCGHAPTNKVGVALSRVAHRALLTKLTKFEQSVFEPSLGESVLRSRSPGEHF